jgi:hypothetical protein
MSPIRLLDMGVVVLLVRAAARELDVVDPAVAEEMVIDKGHVVIGV